jgi:aminoglycoside 6'-N-acetyltransferase
MPMDHDFRALEQSDLKLLARWLAEPHVRQWWGEPGAALNEIREAMESDSTEPMIVEHERRPFAYVQAYDPHLEDGHPYQDQPTGTLGVDFLVGEPSMLRQGHGSALIAALAELLFEEGTPRLVADPDPENAIAVRAFRNAGFVALGARTCQSRPVLLMALDNTQMLEET